MLDWSHIVGFDWDDGNSRKSADKHAVSQAEAEQVFIDDRLLIATDVTHSLLESRFHALATTLAGRLLHVSFTLRANGSKIRVISARDANHRERAAYEKET